MLRLFKRKKREQLRKPYVQVEVTLQEVKEAVNKFEASLSELGMRRTVLIEENNRINFALMAAYLGGIPTKDFFMSRETYEIFEEKDKDIAVYLDMVQEAVDDYITEHHKLPIIDNCYEQRVNFDLLINNYYLKEKPSFPIFISNQHDLVTHNENWRQN